MLTLPYGFEHNPFIIFTFLAAPAILTNACTLMTLSTGNRLARSIDRMRSIASAITAGQAGPAMLSRELAIEQFRPASHRCRVLIRALRACYLAVGSFAAGTCIAILGATLDYFQHEGAARLCVVVMLAVCSFGMLSIVYAAVNLVRETTSTLEMLRAEARGIITTVPSLAGPKG